MEKRVYIYNTPESEQGYLGYVRMDTDQVGDEIGEIYDTEANKIGAIRYEPLDFHAKESLVYDQDGAQVGYVRLEKYEDGRFGGDAYVLGEPDTEDEVVAHLHYDPQEEQVQVHKKRQWGENLGWLKPENASTQELILVGGGATLLMLF